jgi:hypothetical protein
MNSKGNTCYDLKKSKFQNDNYSSESDDDK